LCWGEFVRTFAEENFRGNMCVLHSHYFAGNGYAGTECGMPFTDAVHLRKTQPFSSPKIYTAKKLKKAVRAVRCLYNDILGNMWIEYAYVGVSEQVSAANWNSANCRTLKTKKVIT